VLKNIKYALLVVSLSGCSYSHYSDSKITAYGWSFGSNNALEGMQYGQNKEGTQFQIKGLEQNQVEGIKASGDLLGNAIGTALKVYTGKIP
jgi:hypothetical protein